MSKPATEDKPIEPAREAKPLRRPLTSSDVRRLVDDRVMPQAQGPDGHLLPAPELLRPEWRPVYERLCADLDGKVSAALNRLRKHDPALVLAELILALQTAAAFPRLAAGRQAVLKNRDRAERLRALAREIDADDPPGGINLEALKHRAAAARYAADADAIEQNLKTGPWSRKADDLATAFIGAAARDLARRLFGNGRVDHAAIAALLDAAIEADVGAAAVANALRSTVRTNTRSKAQTARERAE